MPIALDTASATSPALPLNQEPDSFDTPEPTTAALPTPTTIQALQDYTATIHVMHDRQRGARGSHSSGRGGVILT